MPYQRLPPKDGLGTALEEAIGCSSECGPELNGRPLTARYGPARGLSDRSGYVDKAKLFCLALALSLQEVVTLNTRLRQQG